MIFSKFCKFRIQKHKQLRQQFHDRYLNACQVQGFAGLYADQPAADHHGFGNFFLITDFSKIIGILHALQRGDAVKLNTRHRRHIGN